MIQSQERLSVPPDRKTRVFQSDGINRPMLPDAVDKEAEEKAIEAIRGSTRHIRLDRGKYWALTQ
jgi:hypothetical protein